jgi:hypothetical protein
MTPNVRSSADLIAADADVWYELIESSVLVPQPTAELAHAADGNTNPRKRYGDSKETAQQAARAHEHSHPKGERKTGSKVEEAIRQDRTVEAHAA